MAPVCIALFTGRPSRRDALLSPARLGSFRMSRAPSLKTFYGDACFCVNKDSYRAPEISDTSAMLRVEDESQIATPERHDRPYLLATSRSSADGRRRRRPLICADGSDADA